MEIRRAFILSTYALVLTGILSLSLAEGSPVIIAASAGLAVLAYFRAEVAAKPLGRLATTALVFAALFASPLDFSINGDAILSLAHFLIAVQVVKLFGVKAVRDFVQIFLISLMHLGVAAVLTIDLVFSVGFVIYIVIATWTLTLFTLVREVEARSGANIWAVVEGASFRIGRGFFGAAALVSLGTLFFTTGFFLVFPRFSAVLFDIHRRTMAPSVTGFKDEIGLTDLSNMGLNQDDVMRVSVDRPGDRFPQFPKWRGGAFDRYEGGRWKRSFEQQDRRGEGGALTTYVIDETLPASKRWHLIRSDARSAPPSAVAAYRVILEPIGTVALFGIPQVRSLEFLSQVRPGRISVDRADSISTDQPLYTGSIYRAESVPVPREQAREAGVVAGGVIDGVDYLSRPSGSIDHGKLAKFAEKAVEWAGARTPFERAVAIESYLRRSFSYTLDLDRVKAPPGVDPIEHFLFHAKEGHCELFASAFVLLARTQGLPARLVDGFQSGEWNEFGHYYQVRQSDAHAWAEVHFQGVGWVDFDPTPAGDETLRAGLFTRLRQFRDYLKLRWLNYVISFNLSDQLSFADKLRTHVAAAQKMLADVMAALERAVSLPKPESVASTYAALAGAIGAVLAAMALARRRRGARRKPRHAARAVPPVPFFEELIRALCARGWRRARTETAREFAARVVREGGPELAPAAAVVEAFYRVRFGGRPLAPPEEAEVRAALERVRRALAGPPARAAREKA